MPDTGPPRDHRRQARLDQLSDPLAADPIGGQQHDPRPLRSTRRRRRRPSPSLQNLAITRTQHQRRSRSARHGPLTIPLTDVAPRQLSFVVNKVISVPSAAKSVKLEVSTEVARKHIEEEVTLMETGEWETARTHQLRTWLEGQFKVLNAGVEYTGGYAAKTTLVDAKTRKVKVDIDYDVYSDNWEIEYKP